MRRLPVLFLLMALAACGGGGDKPASDPEPAVDPLEASSWRLLFMRSKALPGGLTITAEFADGRVTGRAGCNRFVAEYDSDDGTLEIGPVGGTKMMCPAEVMTWEREFTAFLESAASYRFADDRLLILSEDGQQMTFAPALPGS